MIEIVDAKQKDLDYVRNHPLDENVAKRFNDVKLTGWAKTVAYNGDILGVGGVVVYWPGVGEAWLFLSKHVIEHKLKAAFYVRSMMQTSIEELNLHRLQCTVRADFHKAIKMVERVGFLREGVMKAYTEDKIDTYMYGITF